MKNTIALIFAALFLASCGNKPAPAEVKKTAPVAVEEAIVLSNAQRKNAGLTIGQTEMRPVESTLSVNGSIELPPENLHTISFPLGGFIKSSRLVNGAAVQKGSILATIEDVAFIQMQQDYLTAKSKLAFATADYNRQKELNTTQSNSQKVLQQAKSDFETQRILVNSLAEKLKLIGISPDKLTEDNISRTVNIYSPINGFVSKVNVNPGKYVGPTDVLFEVINPAETHLSLNIFENDAKNLAKGQKVTFNTVGNPNQKLEAEVMLITQNLDENRTVEVHCHLHGNHQKLIPGTFVNAQIKLKSHSSATLPDGAIVDWQGKKYVFVETATNKFTAKEIQTGYTAAGYTEVKTPVEGKLVTSNAYTLLTALKNKAEEE